MLLLEVMIRCRQPRTFNATSDVVLKHVQHFRKCSREMHLESLLVQRSFYTNQLRPLLYQSLIISQYKISPRSLSNNNKFLRFTSTTIEIANEKDQPAAFTNSPQSSPSTNDTIKHIPFDDSHHVIVSNEFIELARQNSFAAESVSRRKTSTMSDFFAKYVSDEMGVHETEIDDAGEREDHGELESDESACEVFQPPPLITYEGKETYFQFDYRNHKTEVNEPMNRLLQKIETTMYNAHHEPFGKFRGVGTIKENIAQMKGGVKFRLGRGRSLERDGSVVAVRKRPENVTGYIQLKRALLRLLKDRHTIYGTGNTNTITEMKWKKVGQSFFGPDSDICINYKHAESILRDLWFRGESDKFTKLQKWHFRLVEKKKQRLLHPRDPDEPTIPVATTKKKKNQYIPRQPHKNRFLWNDLRMAKLEQQLKVDKGIK